MHCKPPLKNGAEAQAAAGDPDRSQSQKPKRGDHPTQRAQRQRHGKHSGHGHRRQVDTSRRPVQAGPPLPKRWEELPRAGKHGHGRAEGMTDQHFPLGDEVWQGGRMRDVRQGIPQRQNPDSQGRRRKRS